MNNYPIGDFLIQIKNTLRVSGHSLNVPKTRYILSTANALKRLGYIVSIVEKETEIQIGLSYKNKEPLMGNIRLVSRPGLRIYKGADELGTYRGSSVFLVSTPKGILSNAEAVKANCGGEIIAEII